MLRACASGLAGVCVLVGCAAEYDIGLFGTGPIEFDLVATQPTSASAVPCQEFCPELAVGSEGGGFSSEWFGIIGGTAKLKGGLDCKTGEFRAELVDGRFGIDPNSPDPGVQALGGELTGHFMGRFVAGPVSSITGSLLFTATVDVEGTFDVERAP
jgi:hypothetical protein